MAGSSQVISRVAFIGYGEAGRAFAAGFRSVRDLEISSFDIKSLASQEIADAHRLICIEDDTGCCEAAALAIGSADAVFSTVTANQALAAAQQAEKCELDGKFYFDCNSCAPQTKLAAQSAVESAGGRYVDVAVMSPVYPKRHEAPVLICGIHAHDAALAMKSLGMNVEIAEGPVGTSSGIKLCRSVVVKGLEAISAEMILAARLLGVDETVIASLDASYPGFDWRKRGSYALDRMMVHGQRRSAEMAEAAMMIKALGIPPCMSDATAKLQNQVGELGMVPGCEDLQDRADRLIKGLIDRTSQK